MAHRNLALWVVPRLSLTAFERMMRLWGDMECWHEPCGEVWYEGENPGGQPMYGHRVGTS
ncbi:MAG: hypothetical protein GY929_22115 [Actinomycetia bacterium]|nr:hypothetical protein [Actinomycetes bacterium]